MRISLLLPIATVMLFAFCQKTAQKTTSFSESQLAGVWKESFEEHESGKMVYRNAEKYEFPPARGRSGWEFLKEGKMNVLRPGPGDKPEKHPASYRLKGNIIEITEGGIKQTYRVLQLIDNKLTVERM